jgi:hypothetical protein
VRYPKDTPMHDLLLYGAIAMLTLFGLMFALWVVAEIAG